WIDGVWEPFCRYELGVADPGRCEAAYQRHHTPGSSWVVDSLTLVHCGAGQVSRFRDGELVRFGPAGKQTERLTERTAIAQLASEVLGLSGLPVEAALRALAERPGAAQQG